jgi:hypothetical protein
LWSNSIGVLDPIDMEDRRIREVFVRRLIEWRADAALPLLVLELPRQTRPPADARVRAGHVPNRRTRFDRAESIGLSHHVCNLIPAPRVTLDADARFVDDAHAHDSVHGRQHTLAGARPRLPLRVDDVGRQDEPTLSRRS